ncbi:MAG: hypothetical protein ACK5MJ_06085 [Alphaproteobacteria bacterium]
MNEKRRSRKLSKTSALLIILATFLWAGGLSFLLFFVPSKKSPIKHSLPLEISSVNQMINATEFAFISRFGAPNFYKTLGDSKLLEYRNSRCVMAVYFSAHSMEEPTIISKKISLLNREDLSNNNDCLVEFVGDV